MNDEVYKLAASTEKLAKVGYEALKDGVCIAYYLNGVLHRDDDHPAYQDFHGTKKWFKEGVLHRTLGPAIISTSTETPELVYYLGGEEITGKDREDFIKLIEASPEEVPLFINHPVLREVAKERLKGLNG